MIWTVIVVVVAHCVPEGVNVYVVVAELFIAGLQLPVIPLVDVVGKEKFSPEQIGDIWLNVGVCLGVIFTIIVADVAHWPELGIKVYTVDCVLLIAGLQVPVIPLFEVDGKLKLFPEHIGPTWVNTGVTIWLIVTVGIS